MTTDPQRARADFLRMMKWIVVAGVLMVFAALGYLVATGDLTRDMVIATTLGVFFSVLLGSGLMAASYFSEKSGHDQNVTDATGKPDERS